MNWTIICTLVSFAIFAIYNVVIDCLCGVPSSLSDTFYVLNEKKKGLGYLFTAMMCVCALLLMPAWIEESVGSPFQCFAFLGAAAIVFVGVAPAFKSGGMEGKVHTIAAVLAAIFSLAWCFAVPNTWYIVFGVVGLVALIAWLTKTISTSYIYWLEMIAFVSTFVSVAVCPYVR